MSHSTSNRREFLTTAAALWLPLPNVPKPEANWYGQVTRKIHFDMHCPSTVPDVGSGFDADKFTAAVKDASAEAVSFFSRCTYGWSYYPTEIGLAHPHLHGDLFGSGVKAMKKAGLRVIAYYAVDYLPKPLADKHPEWLRLDAQGQVQYDKDERVLACPSGDFPQLYLLAQLREIAGRYPVDGFFLDGAYTWVDQPCYCDRCKRAFGGSIPLPGSDRFTEFRHWQIAQLWRISEDLAQSVTAQRAGCLLGVNGMGRSTYSVPPPMHVGFVTDDGNPAYLNFETGFELAAWAWREVPCDVMNQRMLRGWSDFNYRPLEAIEAEFATGIASGGKLFIGDLLEPISAQPNPQSMQIIRRAFQFAQQRESGLSGLRRSSDIAVLSSPEGWRNAGSKNVINDAAVRGAYQALAAHGFTVDVLFDADLAKHLHNYQTLVIPEQAFLTEGVAPVVTRFVQQGGGLLVTGDLPAGLESIAGLAHEQAFNFDLSYLRWSDASGGRPDVAVEGTPAHVKAVGAQLLSKVLPPGTTYQLGARPPGAAIDAPAITSHSHGAGTVVFCALPIAADVWLRNNPGSAEALQAMVELVTPKITARRLGSSTVQMFRARNDAVTMIHLVAFQGGSNPDKVRYNQSAQPVSDVILQIRDTRTPRQITAQPAQETVAWDRDADHLRLRVPPFSIHTAITIHW